jgi:hypothetical protein
VKLNMARRRMKIVMIVKKNMVCMSETGSICGDALEYRYMLVKGSI